MHKKYYERNNMQTRSGQPDDLFQCDNDDDQDIFAGFSPNDDFMTWYPTFPEDPAPLPDLSPPLPASEFEYIAPYFVAEDPEFGRQSIRVFIPFGALPVSGNKRGHNSAFDEELDSVEIQQSKRQRLAKEIAVKIEKLDREKEKIEKEIREIDEKKLVLSQSVLTLFGALNVENQGSTSPSDSFSFDSVSTDYSVSSKR
jgi:hypothetical protein